jgi:predicted SprT family Zn-dependent metalloprotease
MPKKEAPIQQLQQFLPAQTFPAVFQYLQLYKVHLVVARERSSILGDYRHRTSKDNHRISVNGNLNPYAFLITLIHELAHLLTYEQYGNKVLSHGWEWKKIYGSLLAQFLQSKVFPPEIEMELVKMLHNPAASSCAEVHLTRVLRKYDPKKNGHQLIEEMQSNALFKTQDGRVFKKGEKMRKRYRCVEIKTGRIYLFSPVYEAELMISNPA